MNWMNMGVLFILTLHSIAAVVSFIGAIRDGVGFPDSLRWGAIGFTTGAVGLLTRAAHGSLSCELCAYRAGCLAQPRVGTRHPFGHASLLYVTPT